MQDVRKRNYPFELLRGGPIKNRQIGEITYSPESFVKRMIGMEVRQG